ncbi:ribosome-inactivating family protein [Enterobacter ludwigii]
MNKSQIYAIFFVLSIFSKLSHAENSYIIDFGTPGSYVTSLNNIRRDLGTPLPNINVAGNRVYELPPQNSNTRSGIIIHLRGVEEYGDGQEINQHVSFVLDPTNLYVAGFIINNANYYRFSDVDNINIPNVQLIELSNESSYTSLQRIANMEREGMIINRITLSEALNSLSRFNGTALDRSTARALLRFITVIPEAIRFRQIQRGFRTSLNEAPSDYHISNADIRLTLNWSGLSSSLPHVNATLAPAVQVGVIRLPDIQSILATIAVALHCSSNQNSMTEYHTILHESETCYANDTIILYKTIYDKKTLGVFLF